MILTLKQAGQTKLFDVNKQKTIELFSMAQQFKHALQ